VTVFWAEVRHSKGLLGFGVAVVVGWIIANGTLWSGLSIWSNASQAVVVSVLLTGPLFAGVASWDSSRFGRYGLRDHWRQAGDGGRAAVLILASATSFWALASYIVVGALLLVPVGFRATWSQPAWVWLASAGVALLVHVAAGFVAGLLFPSLITPPVAVVALYAADQFVFIGGAILNVRIPLLSWSFNQAQSPTFQPNLAIFASQLAWYLGILVILWTAAVICVTGWRRIFAMVVPVAVLLSAVGVITIFTNPDGPLVLKHQFSYACAGKAPTICVPPAYKLAAEDIRSAVQPVAKRLVGTPFQIDRVELTNRGYLGDPHSGAIAFHMDNMAPGWADQDVLEMAQGILTPQSGTGSICDEGVASTDPGVSQSYLAGVAAWIAGRPDFAAQTDGVATGSYKWIVHLTPESRSKWLTQHVQAICSNSLTAADFE